MNREIKFRGKDIDCNEWRYGSLVKVRENDGYLLYRIVDEENQQWIVFPQTVGQYTGLKDKNGKEIYEGDILHLWGGEYCQGYYEFNQKFIVKDLSDLFFLGECENIEILGNVYDNPELVVL